MFMLMIIIIIIFVIYYLFDFSCVNLSLIFRLLYYLPRPPFIHLSPAPFLIFESLKLLNSMCQCRNTYNIFHSS